ncbi:hypothetical protein Focb16_v009887 [Fusarium oxysporum f. sp. cubense]|uniref:DUF4246 domain-containing protein n=1 Tax=Fusarium oxysporum f. sp. cubense TaxID=61366 RepID=A0A559L1V2_FUSOC|nr:hypothetical protein Focb16_v009887 [Fusarium oxysporum f. sp. cubense]
MARTRDLRPESLTPDEEKILSTCHAMSKLIQEQWGTFNAWVGANSPPRRDTKSWIATTHDLEYNTFSTSEIGLLIKRAKFLYGMKIPNQNSQKGFVGRKPGLELPLGYIPEPKHRFPLLFMEDNYEEGWQAATLTIRESCMLKLVDKLSDKPEWWRKVRDHDIANSKDWHPGSEDQVLDLVHPSLWPLVYGRSRVLQDQVINLKNALASCGTSVILSAPGTKQTTHVFGKGDFYRPGEVMLSKKFQWLPCDTDLNPETGKVKIMSYINNLYPVQHAYLYLIIEQLIEKFLPAWDIIYNWEMQFSVQRLTTIEAVYEECPCPKLCQENDSYGCAPWRRPLNEDREPRYKEEEEDYDEITHKKVQEYKENPKRSRLDDAWFAITHSGSTPRRRPSSRELYENQPFRCQI